MAYQRIETPVSSNLKNSINLAMESVRQSGFGHTISTNKAISAARKNATEFLAHHSDVNGDLSVFKGLNSDFSAALDNAKRAIHGFIEIGYPQRDSTTNYRKHAIQCVENYNTRKAREKTNSKTYTLSKNKQEKLTKQLVKELNSAVPSRGYKKPHKFNNESALKVAKAVNDVKNVVENNIRFHRIFGESTLVGNVDILENPQTRDQHQKKRVVKKALESRVRLVLAAELVNAEKYGLADEEDLKRWHSANRDFKEYALSCVALGVNPCENSEWLGLQHKKGANAFNEFSNALLTNFPQAGYRSPVRDGVLARLNSEGLDPESTIHFNSSKSGGIYTAVSSSELAKGINHWVSENSSIRCPDQITASQAAKINDAKNNFLDQLSPLKRNPFDKSRDIVLESRAETGIREKLRMKIDELSAVDNDSYFDRISSRDLQNNLNAIKKDANQIFDDRPCIETQLDERHRGDQESYNLG